MEIGVEIPHHKVSHHKIKEFYKEINPVPNMLWKKSQENLFIIFNDYTNNLHKISLMYIVYVLSTTICRDVAINIYQLCDHSLYQFTQVKLFSISYTMFIVDNSIVFVIITSKLYKITSISKVICHYQRLVIGIVTQINIIKSLTFYAPNPKT